MKLFIFFFTRGVLVFLLTFTLFSLIRTKYFKYLKKNSSPMREFLLSLLAGFIAVLFLFMFTPNAYIANHGINLTSENFDFVGNFKDRINSGTWGVNIYPFKTIRSYMKYSGFFHTFINIMGNIIIFMPFTFLISAIYKNFQKFYKILIISVVTSLFIEFVQFFIGRAVDIDDVILNVIGGILGYALFKLCERMNFKIARVSR